MRIVLVIPSYNHGLRLQAVLGDAKKLGLPIMVVDDGSTDDTQTILADLATLPENAHIHLVRHRSNQGKGAALHSAFTLATEQGYDWALSMDADGQHLPEDAAHLLARARAAGGRPLVVGVRNGMEGTHVPWSSRAGRGFSNFWVWACGGPRLADSQSGFRLYPLPETLDLGVQAKRYQYEVEVLVLAQTQGLQVLEAPVQVVYQPKGERISHFRPGRDFLRNSATFSRLFFRRFLGRNQ
ncbi:MAG: glycosyltransferase family 2 protein [Desulfobulbaceae bacterium]|nr:glycosyltransferase family 2 protein [Desulfobulbaceae bacterium]